MPENPKDLINEVVGGLNIFQDIGTATSSIISTINTSVAKPIIQKDSGPKKWSDKKLEVSHKTKKKTSRQDGMPVTTGPSKAEML